ATTADGIGVITGTAAGLEMLEVEGRAVATVDAITEFAEINGLERVWSKVFYGYMERTPSGGLHWYYRV
ncbi:hypothetical protein QCD73_19250, partial [Bacillus sp. PsM16]|uniref:hypothetical protein n=1 Tax=Bacillus sp. PsM16 TaxID=3031172 RepID=UPI00263AC17F